MCAFLDMKKANTDQHKGYLHHWISSAANFLHVPEKSTEIKNKKSNEHVHILPATQGFSRKLMSDFIFLFRFTSYGSDMKTEMLQLISSACFWL